MTTVCLVVPGVPALAAPMPEPELPKPTSPWTTPGKPVTAPPTPSGQTRAPASEPEAEPSAEVAAWRAAQEIRAAGGTPTAPATRSGTLASAAETTYVPEGQGQVPWHQFSDTRLHDALVARVNLSNGNLMLAATDFSIAGVGRQLQLTRTYNSLDAAWGKMSQRWWQGYERYAQILPAEVVIHDATGDAIRFIKKADGTFTTPAGYSKDLTKNADGTYTLTDRKSGSEDTYNAHGTLTKVTDKNKGTITVDQYDETAEHKGFKLTETRSGRWIDLVKTDASQWQAKDHTGRTAVFDLNPAGEIAKATDTAGKTTSYDYDTSRRVTKVTTPEGTVTLFTYDAHNRVRSVQRVTGSNGSGHTGPTWRYDYSGATPSAAGTTTVTDPDGDKTVHTHNADGEITKVTDPLGHSRSKTYKNRLVQTATDAMGTGTGGTGGNITAYGWDARNNPSSAKLPTGATADVSAYQTIAGTDLPKSFSAPDGQKEDYTYDTNGNTETVTTTGTAGGQRSYTYNKATPTCGGFEGQRCTSKDANGKVTSFTYDTKGNLAKVTPPAPLGAVTYTYDGLGRVETVTDGRGIKSVYDYDTRDRVKKVSSTSMAVAYTYDGDGNLTSRTDASGTTVWTFDKLNREATRTLQKGAQTILAYTPGGEIDYYTDPNGTTDYTWDAAGRLDFLTDPAGKKTDYDYNNNDKRTKTVYPGGTTQTVTLDESSRPEAIKTTSGTTTLVDLTYTYGYGPGAGTDGTKIRTRTDNATKLTTSYTYDSQGRLQYAKEANASGVKQASWLYCHDKAGNLTHYDSSAATCPTTPTFGYNDASQLISKGGSTDGWAYDKSGNELAATPGTGFARSSETWSDHSQLTTITTSGTARDAVHAGTDNSERTKLGDTWFHHTALGLTGTTTAGVDTGFIREPAGTLNSMRTGGKSYYYLTDATGNILGLVDEQGARTHTYAYNPTGRARAITESIPQPYRFAGAYADPTGLHKMGARYYDPNTARFTQPDPSGQEVNLYLYAQGDPINHTDPTGLDTRSNCLKAGLTFVGAGLGLAGVAITAPSTAGASLAAAGALVAGAAGAIDAAENQCF
ncbi:RHS repeat-associated core domain-containing protein [Streptomyces sp. NPDC015131]|uniref:RHS repeat-associated core domain-containing protein n=1 Tax=Streptomyces sp. NPDC015131 TaxID=3364941 RepID=UPI003701A2E6